MSLVCLTVLSSGCIAWYLAGTQKFVEGLNERRVGEDREAAGQTTKACLLALRCLLAAWTLSLDKEVVREAEEVSQNKPCWIGTFPDTVPSRLSSIYS